MSLNSFALEALTLKYKLDNEIELVYTCGRYPNSFTHDALTLKYKLDNEFELVYVVGILTHSPMKLLHSKYKLDNEFELVYTCGRYPNSFALEALTLEVQARQ